MSDTFSYTPQRVFVEEVHSTATVVRATGRDSFAHRVTGNLRRRFRLEFGPLPSTTVDSIAAFYDSHDGPLTPFNFVNPNDQETYHVRFASQLSRHNVIGTLLKTGQVSLEQIAVGPNMLKSPEAFDDTSVWNGGGNPLPTVTANKYANPIDGRVTADELSFPAGGNTVRILQDVAVTIPFRFIGSIWLRYISGDLTYLTLHAWNGVEENDQPLTAVTGSWQRFSGISLPYAGGQTTAQIGILNNNASAPAMVVAAWGAKLEAGSVVTPYTSQ